MPGGDKTGSQACVWRKNATFVPMKPNCRKLFFVFSNQWRAKPRAKQVCFLDFHAEVKVIYFKLKSELVYFAKFILYYFVQ